MAYIQMNVLSQSLMRTVPVNVILPVDKMLWPGMKEREEKPYKTLYLLHGILGNYTDWVNGTRIQRYAEEHDLVVVMPSGDNAFYVDHKESQNYYGEFIGKELVDLTRKMFPLSRKREDTFIGGLSMGGYGALRNGLKYHDTFGAIIALSSPTLSEEMQRRTNESPLFFLRKDFTESNFGDLSKMLESDMNPKYIVEQLLKQNAKIPELYFACGLQDDLLKDSKDMVAFLEQRNIPVTFEVGPGNHEWDFWDTYIKRAIEWLPTEDAFKGIHSGNIGK